MNYRLQVSFVQILALLILTNRVAAQESIADDKKINTVEFTHISVKDFAAIRYRDLSEFDQFSEYEDLGGLLIGKYEGIEFGVGHYKMGDIHLLVLEEIVRVTPTQVMNYAHDIIKISGLSETQNITMGTCTINEKFDTEIIAIYDAPKDFDDEYYPEIVMAWRAKLSLQSFSQIKIEEVNCANESYGVW